MAMRRTTLILIIILAVAVIGGSMYLWATRTTVAWPWAKTVNTSTTNTSSVNTNAVVTPTNLSTPQDLSGDTPLTSSIKIGATDLKFTSLDRVTTFDQTPAPENEQYVVMYFEGVEGAATGSVFTVLSASQLVNGDQRLLPNKLKVAGNIVKNDRGYIVFVVPTNAAKLVLEVGAAPDVQRVELP